jgi:hypothetical protein
VNKSGVDVTFLDDVSRGLTNGKFAVLAEIKESWTTPVDTRVHKLGGIVFRRLRGDAVSLCARAPRLKRI